MNAHTELLSGIDHVTRKPEERPLHKDRVEMVRDIEQTFQGIVQTMKSDLQSIFTE